MVKDDILKIQKKEDLRQSLSSLRASLKDMENVKAAKELLGDARAVAELLKEEDPKVRKNAAALLGIWGQAIRRRPFTRHMLRRKSVLSGVSI